MIVLCQDNRRAFYGTHYRREEYGSRLRTLRVERGWSQQTLSDKLEVLAIYICRGSVSRIEDKRRTVTDIELYGLSQVLGVPIESLFEDLPNE